MNTKCKMVKTKGKGTTISVKYHGEYNRVNVIVNISVKL